MIKRLTLPIATLCLSALIVSCGGEVEDTAPKYNFERAETLPDGYLEELGIVKTNIEVTAHLYERMFSSGYAFNEGIMLSSSKSFSGTSKQAMGIGAIGSDIVYCSTFGQNQSAMNRMEGLMKTAGAVGIAEAFDQELIQQMASEDTSINKSVLLTKAYLKAKDQLFSDERAQYATFMVIGGWLEGLHIGAELVKAEIKDKEIQIGFWELCNSYESVVHMCEVFKDNSEMANVQEQIKSLYPQINAIKKNAKKYTTEDVAALSEALNNVRNSIY